MDASSIGDALRLNLLAPDIIEMILDGRQPPTLQLDKLRKSIPLEWRAQREAIRAYCPATSALLPVADIS